MPHHPSDIRLELKVRNNLLLTAMENRGITSISELCRQIGIPISYSQVVSLVSMKISARNKNGDWLLVVHHLSEFFQCMPEDIFSNEQQSNALRKNRAYAELSFAEIQSLTVRRQEPITPELAMQADQLRSAVGEVLHKLLPREERALRMKFGFVTGEQSGLKEIGEELGVSKERARQIISYALRKLKHPSISRKMRIAGSKEDILDEDVFGSL